MVRNRFERKKEEKSGKRNEERGKRGESKEKRKDESGNIFKEMTKVESGTRSEGRGNR